MLEGFRKELVQALRAEGVKELTPIQSVAIPKILSGRHTLIIAPTGSGKTEAALIPVMNKMLYHHYNPVSAIYITPLRALNRDIFLRLKRVGRRVGLRVAVRHGDTSSSSRRAIAHSPPDILITTPETLAYLLVSAPMRRHLSNVRWVIIDEFHELLSSKRGTHMLADLERLRNLSKGFQRIALSASIGDVELAAEALAPSSKVEVAQVSGVRESEVKVLAPVGDVDGKVEVIAGLVRRYRPVLIFTNTRDEAEWLALKIKAAGLKVRVHHGSLSKAEREEVESCLRSGSLDAVVSTSSLELGIDVGRINAVIQSSSPKQATKFLQRVGRSLHKVGSTARGFIVTDLSSDDMIESLVIARRAKEGNLEGLRPYRLSSDVLTHVLVGMGLEGNGVTLDDVLDTLNRSYPYRELDSDLLNNVVDLASRLHYLRRLGRLTATMKGKLYYLKTTMIVDTEQYRVVDALTYRTVGRLDSDFVRISVSEGSTIVLSGRVWKVISVDDDELKIYVEESSGEALIPSWVGENIPVDFKVAREVCALRRLIALDHIPMHYRELSDEGLLDYVARIITEHVRKGYPFPHERNLVIEVVPGKNVLLIVHACLGSRGNRALSYMLSYPFTKYLGVEPRVKVDPYRVFLEVPQPLGTERATALIKDVLLGGDVREVIGEGLKRSGLGMLIAHKILSRLGIIPREAPSQVAKVILKRYMDEGLVWSEVLNEAFTRYLDLEPLQHLVSGVRSGSITLKIIDVSSPSPLAAEGMKVYAGFDRVRVAHMPRDVIAELVRRRLLSKEVRLYCMVCGHSWRAKLSDLPERISCPKCGYSLVAPYFGGDDVSELVRRGLRAGRRYKYVLSGEERKVFEELLDSADLVLTYGKKAVIALAARGVGPRTARRLLGVRDEVSFFYNIYEAERTFLRTRKYWKG